MSKAPEQRCTITTELWLLSFLVVLITVFVTAYLYIGRN